MITKLRKAQDSWVAKLIFILTALSFMSLFGISGYLDRAASNPAVIRVNNRKISLAEFNMQLDEQIRLAHKLFGDIEISDEMREAMVNELVQKNLTEQIIKETASKERIYISDSLIRSIITSQPQFRDENGHFNPARFHNFLSSSNWSENRYVETMRNDIIKRFLISNPVSNIKVSKTLLDLAAKSESQRRIFKYIELSADNIKIDRKITDEEIDQYYQDFASEFIEPEKRNITVLEITFENIAEKVEISEDEINDFYKENLSHFVVPEKREVLQMLFADEATARKAFDALKSGADFYDTADKIAGQTREETSLGVVDKDMLIAEVADDVFHASLNGVVGPVESEHGWHIMKVKSIIPGSKTNDEVAHKQILDTLRTEKAYEHAYDIIKKIDDKIGSGATLEEIANENGLKLKTVNNLTDTAVSPYIETAFSYNVGEISQATETDNGFAFIRIDSIVESHPQTPETAMPQIKQLWAENEKSAILNEIINDVMHDLENGDSINEVASRYKLKLNTTDALTRSQSFAGLNQTQMSEIFNEALNSAKQFNLNGKTIIAVAADNASPRSLSDEDKNIINRRLSLDTAQQASSQLINSYGNKYDVRVKYRQLGLED